MFHLFSQFPQRIAFSNCRAAFNNHRLSLHFIWILLKDFKSDKRTITSSRVKEHEDVYLPEYTDLESRFFPDIW